MLADPEHKENKNIRATNAFILTVADMIQSVAPERARFQALKAEMGALAAPSARAGLDLGDPALNRALPQGGLALAAVHEAAPAAAFDSAAAYGFLLALAACAQARRGGTIVWVRAGRPGRGFDFGAPYGPGLAGLGLAVERLILVRAGKPERLAWALEEAARTPGLAAVVGEAGGDASLLAARRLQLAAETGGAPILVWRPCGGLPNPAARSRWRIAARPAAGTGPAWRAELARARGGAPGSFDLEWRHETHSLRVASVLEERTDPPLRAFSADLRKAL